MIGRTPAAAAAPARRFQTFSSFQASETRTSAMPAAFITRQNSSTMHCWSDPNRFRPPPFMRSGVRPPRAASSRTRSIGSSRRSRTHLPMKDGASTSSAPNPARSSRSTTGSIMPVVIHSAHRLCWPSRSVTSTNSIFSIGGSSLSALRSISPRSSLRSSSPPARCSPVRLRNPRGPSHGAGTAAWCRCRRRGSAAVHGASS